MIREEHDQLQRSGGLAPNNRGGGGGRGGRRGGPRGGGRENLDSGVDGMDDYNAGGSGPSGWQGGGGVGGPTTGGQQNNLPLCCRCSCPFHGAVATTPEPEGEEESFTFASVGAEVR